MEMVNSVMMTCFIKSVVYVRFLLEYLKNWKSPTNYITNISHIIEQTPIIVILYLPV